MKISIELNALSLSLWNSITFDFFLQIKQTFQWYLKMHWAIAFYANHMLGGLVDACWSENAKFYIFEVPPKNLGLFLPYFKTSEK